MYTQIWNKYLPIIKILLKKSVAAEQSLNLNVSDFEKIGSARKAGYKFTIHFRNARVDNVISASDMAKDLAYTLLQDDLTKDLFVQNDYHITMNTKFQLAIKFIPKEVLETEEVGTGEAVESEVPAAL